MMKDPKTVWPSAIWISLVSVWSPVKGALIIELVDVDRLKKRLTLEEAKLRYQWRAGRVKGRQGMLSHLFIVC